MLTNQAQQNVLAISNYFINLFFSIGNEYCKMLKLNAYTDTLKKHLYDVLDYTEVEFFYPPML